MTHSPDSTFGERFGFACWLYYLRERRAPSMAALGKAGGRTGPAVTAWLDAIEAPPDWKIQNPISEFLGVSAVWLFQDMEPAPEKSLWEVWLKTRRHPKLARVEKKIGLVDASLRLATKRQVVGGEVRNTSRRKGRN